MRTRAAKRPGGGGGGETRRLAPPMAAAVREGGMERRKEEGGERSGGEGRGVYASVSVRVCGSQSQIFLAGVERGRMRWQRRRWRPWEGAMALIFVRISHGLLLTVCLRTAKNVTHSDARVF